MKTSHLIGGAALALSAATPGAATVPTGFKAQADQIVASAWKADQPGAAVIVTERGKVVYATGRGLADLEARTPITTDTVFRIGSVAKQFSAAVMMQLVAEGKVALDDPLSKYLPDYPQPGAAATVRQLLNHTSGIQSYTAIPGWMVEANTNRAYTTAQMIDQFKDQPMVSKPGETWAYNNSGYLLVGAIIEKVTGKAWHEAIAERIAGPLQLPTLRFGENPPAKMAKGYQPTEGGFKLAQPIHMSVPHAAGGLIGTVGDLAAWANALHHGKVVSAQGYRAMTTPASLAAGGTFPYGFGLQLGELRGMKQYAHSGGIFGFVAQSAYIPEKDVFVAVLTNSAPPVTSPDAVAAKLAALAAGDPFPTFTRQAADEKGLAPFYGTYAIADGKGERLFYSEDGQLFTRRNDQPLEVFAVGDNRFAYEDGMTWFELKRGAGGPVMEMHQPASKTPEIAVRSGPVPAAAKAAEVSNETLSRYVGSYVVGDARAVVTLGDDGLSVKLGDQPTLKLIPRSQTEFEVARVGAKVTFNSDGKAPARSMTIDQGGRKMEAPRGSD